MRKGVLLFAFVCATLINCNGCVHTKVVPKSLMSDAEMEEDLKEFQYQQAKIGAARNACKEDCAPGTLQGYSLKNDICECYPPDSSVVPHGHINGL